MARSASASATPWGLNAARSYAVVSALVGLFLIALVLLAMPIWIAQTAGQTALNMIGRALLPLVGLALLAPLVGPVLYAAKNRAAGTADRQGDAAPDDDRHEH